ncbi:hypothetical protein WJX79_005151 [Trebouxia sp. C0005]
MPGLLCIHQDYVTAPVSFQQVQPPQPPSPPTVVILGISHSDRLCAFWTVFARLCTAAEEQVHWQDSYIVSPCHQYIS